MVTVDVSSSSAIDELPPGFRFHPTDEEIITHYLSQKIVDSTFTAKAIGQVDFNKCEPWDLPKRASMDMGEKEEWYFFCQRDRKYPTGMRTNRATEAGYWKATGKDKEIFKPGRNRNKNLIGMKKTLVFYTGRAPKGEKTNWVMHEYRLDHGNQLSNYQNNLPKSKTATKDDWVVCRVFHKTTGVKKSPLLISDNHHHHLLRINSFGDDFFDSPSLRMHMPPLLDHPSSPYLLSSNNSRPPLIDNNNNSYNVDRFPAKIMATTDDARHFYSRNMYDDSNNNFLSTNNTPASHNHNPLFSYQASLINSGYLHHQEMNNNSLVLLGPDDDSQRQCKVEQYSSNNQSLLSMSQDTGLSTDINTTTDISSKHDMGRSSRPYEDLEATGPSSSEGPVVDLECLWNY